jgi:endonuclease/exonuclease/phosphatase family metal-dependent hydrolase
LGHHLFREAEELPTVIIGDSNDWRNQLSENLFEPKGFQQLTTPISRFRSFPSYLAMGSLDKAFVRGPIHVRQVRIVRTRLAKNASDHLPLIVDLHLDHARQVEHNNGQSP